MILALMRTGKIQRMRTDVYRRLCYDRLASKNQWTQIAELKRDVTAFVAGIEQAVLYIDVASWVDKLAT